MGFARRPREEVERLPGRSRMAYQARRNRKERPDRRAGGQFVPAADQLLGGEVGECPPLTLPRFARVPPSPRWRGEGWGEGFAPAGEVRLFPAPAPCGFVVLGAGFDPALALPRLLALPERRLGLQPVYEEMASRERGFAMRRGGRDQDDALAGLQPPIAVDDQGGGERPAPVGLGLDLGELLLGHARVVFEDEGGDAVVPSPASNDPDKARDAANVVVAGGEPVEFGADIEILALDPNHSLSLRSSAGRGQLRRPRGSGGPA